MMGAGERLVVHLVSYGGEPLKGIRVGDRVFERLSEESEEALWARVEATFPARGLHVCIPYYGGYQNAGGGNYGGNCKTIC